MIYISIFFQRTKPILITDVICGYSKEEIDNALTKQVLHLGKFIDELVKGRKMEKILRKSVDSILKIN